MATSGKAQKDTPQPTSSPPPPLQVDASSSVPNTTAPRRKLAADSTDWIASALTRRFGIGAGLAWVGFLAFGVISEQVKTRLEVYQEESNSRDVESADEVVTSEGVRIVDLRVGGGSSPFPGDLIIISLVGRVLGSNTPFVDTTAVGGRDRVLTFGARPFTRGLCAGLEIAIRGMRVGGKRRVVVPPMLGFGPSGAVVGAAGVVVPADATLEYVVQLQRTSIAPS